MPPFAEQATDDAGSTTMCKTCRFCTFCTPLPSAVTPADHGPDLAGAALASTGRTVTDVHRHQSGSETTHASTGRTSAPASEPIAS